MTENETSRRNVVLGVAAAGVAVPVLAACGSSDPESSATPTDTPSTPSDTPSTPSGTTSSPAGGDSGIKTSDIPVGGGKVFADEQIVVTQPTEGEFKAFSAVCTHSGCLVNQVENKQIKCPCHFSRYSIEDGQVEGGPAPSPLPEKTVKVTGDTLTVS